MLLELLMPGLQGLFILLVAILAIALALWAIALALWAIAKVLDTVGQPANGPRKKLLGQLGRVTAPVSDAHKGKVVVWGEIWDALPVEPLGEGNSLDKDTEVRVEAFDALDERVVRVCAVSRNRPAVEC